MPDPCHVDLAALPPGRRLARGTLLFLSARPWLPEDHALWHALTGERLVTVAALKALARQVDEARSPEAHSD